MSDRLVQEAVMHLAGTKNTDPLYLFDAKVVSVDEGARTCTVQNLSTGVNVTNVRLMAVIDDGVLIIPKVGSQIIACRSNVVLPYICQFSEVEKVLLIVGDTTIEIKDGSIKLNDGSYHGLVRVQDLTTRLNKIEQDINALKQAFASWTVVATDGGGALKAIAATWYSQTLQETQQSDIENTKITHGK